MSQLSAQTTQQGHLHTPTSLTANMRPQVHTHMDWGALEGHLITLVLSILTFKQEIAQHLLIESKLSCCRTHFLSNNNNNNFKNHDTYLFQLKYNATSVNGHKFVQLFQIHAHNQITIIFVKFFFCSLIDFRGFSGREGGRAR